MPRMRKTIQLVSRLCLLGALFATGCEQPKSKTAVDLTTDQEGAALRVPPAALAVATRIRDGEAETRASFANLPGVADKLSETDVDVVVSVIEAADEAGEDPAYGHTSREMAATAAFFEEEKDALTKKIGGSVQYQAQQKGCEIDAWGSVAGGLKDGVKERIEERMKASNDAFLIIERNRDAIGKKNVEIVETMATEIAKASYFVHVQMEFAEEDLKAAKSAAEDAKSDIQKFIEEENEVKEGAAKPSPEAEKAKKERLTLAEERIKIADQAIAANDKELDRIKERQSELRTAYDTALSNLTTKVKAKKK